MSALHPAILRKTRGFTRWDNGTTPTGTTVVIFADFLHRDDPAPPFADRFHPDSGRSPPATLDNDSLTFRLVR